MVDGGWYSFYRLFVLHDKDDDAEVRFSGQVAESPLLQDLAEPGLSESACTYDMA